MHPWLVAAASFFVSGNSLNFLRPSQGFAFRCTALAKLAPFRAGTMVHPWLVATQKSALCTYRAKGDHRRGTTLLHI
jgi:hypothetical protein